MSLWREISRTAFLAMAAFLYLLPASSSGRQKQDPKPNDAQDVIKLGTDLVTVNVQVAGSDGRKMLGLVQKDFKVYEDDVEQEVSFFAKTTEPFDVALLLDISGSTKTQVDLIKKAATRFIDQLHERDRVAIISFGDDATIESDLSADRAALKKSIDQIEALPASKAGTNFYDAIDLVTDNILKPVKGRKAIVVLTDGVDTNSVNDYEDVLPKIQESGGSAYFIRVDTENYTLSLIAKNRHEPGHVSFTQKQLKKYMAAFAPDEDPGRYLDNDKLSYLEKREINHGMYELAREELDEMASKGAGRVYPIGDLAQASEAFGEIASELRTIYSIGYYPSNVSRDGKWRGIRVQVDVKNAKPAYRKGYQAPKDSE